MSLSVLLQVTIPLPPLLVDRDDMRLDVGSSATTAEVPEEEKA